MDKQRYLQHLSTGINLPSEPMPGIPLVEVLGDKRVLIERHQGVIAYDQENIRVRVRFGLISVCGCNLTIAQMTKIHLIICGQIESVRFVKEGVCRK